MTTEKIKREKIIKVRVTPEEHETLKHICPKAQLAEWMREHCLNPTVDFVNASKAASGSIVDPDLLRALAGIGNNMNQVGRKVNTGEWGPSDKMAILAALKAVENQLAEIRNSHR